MDGAVVGGRGPARILMSGTDRLRCLLPPPGVGSPAVGDRPRAAGPALRSGPASRTGMGRAPGDNENIRRK